MTEKKPKKRIYKKGMELFHKETKFKVVFGKFNEDGSAGCITKDHKFINIPREEMDNDYKSYSEVEKEAKERRRGQAW